MAFPGISKAPGHAPEGVNARMSHCIIFYSANFSPNIWEGFEPIPH